MRRPAGSSAAHWFAPASLLALPLELGAETVLVAGVEVVLVGELHELHGRPAARRRPRAGRRPTWPAGRPSAPSTAPARPASAPCSAPPGMRELRRRVTRRLARRVPSAAPFLVGAALGGRGNRRATETLAERVRTDLRAAAPRS